MLGPQLNSNVYMTLYYARKSGDQLEGRIQHPGAVYLTVVSQVGAKRMSSTR